MFSTPEFWVFIAFLIFLVVFGKKGLDFLAAYLDKYRGEIRDTLAEAQRLHDEALSLLTTYQKKREEALEQAHKIMDDARKEAEAFRQSSEKEFQKVLAQKEKALLERIAMETEATKTALKQQAADEAFAIVESVLAKDEKLREKLTKAAVKDIAGLELKE